MDSVKIDLEIVVEDDSLRARHIVETRPSRCATGVDLFIFPCPTEPRAIEISSMHLFLGFGQGEIMYYSIMPRRNVEVLSSEF